MKRFIRIALIGFLVVAVLMGIGLYWFLNLKLEPVAALTDPVAGRQLDLRGIESLLDACRESNTEALVVMKDGKVVLAWQKGGWHRRIETMSVTKSIVNLAIGRLVTLGRISSIDLPVSYFFPQWKDGMKSRVTLRHLMMHTSGLQANRMTHEIYAQSDFVKHALDSEIQQEPGSRFFYNNKASNLLSGVVGQAAGRPMDTFLRHDLFARMGITDFRWKHDKAGNAHGMSGLIILPADLAKLGQLIVDRGIYGGERLIDASWFDECEAAARSSEQGCGLLWWMRHEPLAYIVDDAKLDELRAAGVDNTFLEQFGQSKGRYATHADLVEAWKRTLGPDAVQRINEVIGPFGALAFKVEKGRLLYWSANGWLGQWLVIYPEQRLVGVRLSEYPLFGDPDASPDVEFVDFPTQLLKLLPAKLPTPEDEQ